jgi:hypothetical protein
MIPNSRKFSITRRFSENLGVANRVFSCRGIFKSAVSNELLQVQGTVGKFHTFGDFFFDTQIIYSFLISCDRAS